MTKDAKEFTEVELKAAYFDEMAKVEFAQENMKVLMQELQARGQQASKSPKEEVKEEPKEEVAKKEEK